MQPPALQLVTTVGACGTRPGVGDGASGGDIPVSGDGASDGDIPVSGDGVNAGGVAALRGPMPVAANESKLVVHNTTVDAVKNKCIRFMLFPMRLIK
jgi:hypothetical protein